MLLGAVTGPLGTATGRYGSTRLERSTEVGETRSEPVTLLAADLDGDGAPVAVQEVHAIELGRLGDAVDLLQNLGHRILLVMTGQQDRTGAELAAVRAAAAGLHRQPVVPLDLQQFECRHRSIGQIEAMVHRAVAVRELPGLAISKHGQPARFSLSDDHSVAVSSRLVG